MGTKRRRARSGNLWKCRRHNHRVPARRAIIAAMCQPVGRLGWVTETQKGEEETHDRRARSVALLLPQLTVWFESSPPPLADIGYCVLHLPPFVFNNFVCRFHISSETKEGRSGLCPQHARTLGAASKQIRANLFLLPVAVAGNGRVVGSAPPCDSVVLPPRSSG